MGGEGDGEMGRRGGLDRWKGEIEMEGEGDGREK